MANINNLISLSLLLLLYISTTEQYSYTFTFIFKQNIKHDQVGTSPRCNWNAFLYIEKDSGENG